MIDIQFDINTARTAFDPDTDFMPMLVITGTDGKVTMCALAVDDPAGYLALVLSKHILECGPIESVSFTSDVFSASDDSVPRPLDRAFAAGDPRVTEALSVTRCARGGVVEAAVIPYLRTSDGVVWGEVRRLDEPGGKLSGRVIDALRASLGEYTP
jgi:hypothetical protein